MADNVLSIVLNAETEKAQKAIEDFAKKFDVEIKGAVSVYDAFEKKIKEVETALKNSKSPEEVAKLTTKLREAKSAFNEIKTGQFSTQVATAAKSSNQASFAVLNLGRIAQDSAFGFIGIANNIEPFIQSVTALRASATQGASATKQFFGALAGPAGIGLLIGAAQLFDAYQNGYGIFANKAKVAEKAQKDFNEELNKVKAPAIAAGVQLQAFVDIAANSALPLAQRNKALEEGNKIIGDYGEKLTLANVASKKITDQTKLFTEALIAQAVAGKFAEKVADLTLKQAEATIQLSKAEKDLKVTSDAAIKALTNLSTRDRELGRGTIFLIQRDNATKALKAAQDNLNTTETDLTSTTELANKAIEKSTSLFGQLGTGTKDAARAAKDAANALKEQNKTLNEAAKAAADFQREFNGIIAPIQKLTQSLSDYKPSVTAQLISANKELSLLLLTNLTAEQKILAIQQQKLVIAERAKIAANIAGMPTTAGANLLVQKAPVTLGTDVASDEKKLANLTAIQQKTDEIKTAFSLLGPIIDASFNALAGGENAVEGLKAAIKSLIIQLLKAAALAAIISIATGGAAGGGTSFLSAFKSILGLPGKAQGGTVNSGSPYLIGENGPELFVPTGSGNIVSNGRFGNMGGGGGTLSARVSGGDLLFILNQAGNNRSVNFG